MKAILRFVFTSFALERAADDGRERRKGRPSVTLTPMNTSIATTTRM
jgi:hypothetical protein